MEATEIGSIPPEKGGSRGPENEYDLQLQKRRLNIWESLEERLKVLWGFGDP